MVCIRFTCGFIGGFCGGLFADVGVYFCFGLWVVG